MHRALALPFFLLFVDGSAKAQYAQYNYIHTQPHHVLFLSSAHKHATQTSCRDYGRAEFLGWFSVFLCCPRMLYIVRCFLISHVNVYSTVRYRIMWSNILKYLDSGTRTQNRRTTVMPVIR